MKSIWRNDSADKFSGYNLWMNNFAFTDKKRKHVLSEIEGFSYKPLISIATPVYNIEEVWLEKCIQSVLEQTYANWELCIVDDASTRGGLLETLQGYADRDARIRLKYLPKNLHISGATNEAVGMASGEFIALLDHDDELHPNALFEVVNLLQSERDADIIYTDNDMINTDGKRFNPKFKPDWSPELLLSYMYISHLMVCRTALLRDAGGYRKGYEGSQDHDLALRLSEKTDRIHHIPKILYHARTLPASVSGSGDAKPYSFLSGIKAVQDAVARRGLNATVERPDFAVKAGYGIYKLNFNDIGKERVAIIIPTRDKADMLKRCITSIEEKTTYKNYEIVIADDQSREEATLNYFGAIRHKVINTGDSGHFNFSKIINRAVRGLDGDIEYILFLNNDTEVLSGNWLEEMLGWMRTSRIGAVGTRLLYPDNTVQHAGIIAPLHEGLPGHAFKTLPASSMGYLSYAKVVRNYSAVTGACMLTRRSYFEEVGGFDEEKLSESYNDVDYCLKLREKGYRIVFTPYAELYHYEGKTRGRRVPVRNEYHFRKRWGHIRIDPYYNPNLEGWLFDVRKDIREVLPVSRKIRVLLITNNLNSEGAPLSLLSIAKGLDRERYEVLLFSPVDGVLKEAWRNEGIEVLIRESKVKGIAADEFESDMKGLAGMLREQGIDVIFCNTLDTYYGHHVARALNIPSIWCIRESVNIRKYFREYCKSRTLSGLAVRTYEVPSHLIFVSRETAKLYGDLQTKGSVNVIYNGLEMDEIEKYKIACSRSQLLRDYAVPEGKKVITTVGQTIPRKGQHIFIGAAISLLKKRDDLLFLIVGGRDYDYRDRLEEMIRQSKTGDCIRIIPETQDVYPYYRLSDIFVCSSFEESFPRVVLEAMAFGLPIVATNVFGIREQIGDKREGLLVPPGNPVLLSNAIESLLNDEASAIEMAENAYYRVVNRFTYQDMIASYERCITECMFLTPEPYDLRINSRKTWIAIDKSLMLLDQYVRSAGRNGYREASKRALRRLYRSLKKA
ncbi:MAG: glycosyltransferase [Nitrospirae bacterium]|nr:glycosyltransferase [Nitrospirota bacterium]